jgi:hypothetical protein
MKISCAICPRSSTTRLMRIRKVLTVRLKTAVPIFWWWWIFYSSDVQYFEDDCCIHDLVVCPTKQHLKNLYLVMNCLYILTENCMRCSLTNAGCCGSRKFYFLGLHRTGSSTRCTASSVLTDDFRPATYLRLSDINIFVLNSIHNSFKEDHKH